MANAWGAGCFRFKDRELEHFPFGYSELKSFYDEVTEEVGINGEEDDLTPALGETTNLLPPQPLPKIAQVILNRYRRKKAHFLKNNFLIGRLRLAILTRDLGKRKASSFDNLEFFRPHIPSIYNPIFTLETLIQENRLTYQPGILVESFSEDEKGVTVEGLNLKTNQKVFFQAKKLILAAGTLNTTRLVLNANQDFTTVLKLVENPISYVPFIDFSQIGKPVEKKASPSFFGVMFDQPKMKDTVWCSMYGLWGPMRSEYLFDFPLAARGAVRAARGLTSGMIIVQCFYPGTHEPYRVKLESSGQLSIQANQDLKSHEAFERHLIKTFRKIHLYSHPSLIKHPAPGNSFHYAATLPMKKEPGPYETYPDGRLFGRSHVYVADAANFSSLPAINHTLTIMANALRIGTLLERSMNRTLRN